MPAFIDMRCGKCGKKYGYFGEVKDAKCPHCGAVPVGLDNLEKQLQDIRDEMNRQIEKEWKERTPEQEKVYKEGQTAFLDGIREASNKIRLTDHHKSNPYRGTPLQKWFVKGWTNAFLDAERRKQ